VDLKRANASLALERNTTHALREEKALLRAETESLKGAAEVTFKGKKVALRDAVKEVATKVNVKSARIAATNVASMPGEAIPIWGVGVIVASVALEIEGTCEIMTEMHELQVSVDPSLGNDPELTEVCGMKVPSRAELLSKVKESPNTIWLGAKRTYQNLPDPDFSGEWRKFLEYFK
jgi:hypothetical protein